MPILNILIFQNIARDKTFFKLYFYNFILEILFNPEKRDPHFCIQIDEFYRFSR